MGLLFILSFILHWTQSARVAAQEALAHGEKALGTMAYLADPQLWFESFQNWQSEFLSTAVLVFLSIFLRSANRRNRRVSPRCTARQGNEVHMSDQLERCPGDSMSRQGRLSLSCRPSCLSAARGDGDPYPPSFYAFLNLLLVRHVVSLLRIRVVVTKAFLELVGI